ncbi:unnamed protein product, partial [Rotaria magnacalcarata]
MVCLQDWRLQNKFVLNSSIIESAKGNEANGTIGPSAILNNNLVTHTQQSLMTDESTLSRLVADRLDLPISRRLLDQHFELSVIKQCWEDQL